MDVLVVADVLVPIKRLKKKAGAITWERNDLARKKSWVMDHGFDRPY